MKNDNKTLILKYLEKYPTTPNMTLAKLICEDEFGDSSSKALDNMRASIRYYRGAFGATKRKSLADSTYAEIWDSINVEPEVKEEIKDYVIKTEHVGIVADIHFPYHDQKALKTALHNIFDSGCDSILLNGDIADFYALSDFNPDPRRSLKEELNILKKFLKALRSDFKGNIYYKFSNHEQRLDRYIMKNAAKLYGADFLRLENILGLKDMDIYHIPWLDKVKVSHLNVFHGHEFGKEGLVQAVNPARSLFLKTHSTSFQSHSHRTSQHVEPNVNGEIITCWSGGCLCDLKPSWRPYANKWNHGFTKIKVDKRGIFKVANLSIYDGEVL